MTTIEKLFWIHSNAPVKLLIKTWPFTASPKLVCDVLAALAHIKSRNVIIAIIYISSGKYKKKLLKSSK
jgi:hypothetical protein